MSKVIQGKYKGKKLYRPRSWLTFRKKNYLKVWTWIFPGKKVTERNVRSWELLDTDASKDVGSMVGRGLIGSFLLGPLGMLAGAASAREVGHYVRVNWRNGKTSVMLLSREDFVTFQMSV